MSVLRSILAAALAIAAPAAGAEDFGVLRARMVEEIRASYRDARTGTPDPHVLGAIGRVPRHEFVPPQLAAAAYENRPLPIGEEQTISQPYIVALMTDLARVRKGGRVLEVGTGSGYPGGGAGRAGPPASSRSRSCRGSRRARAIASRGWAIATSRS
jgi:protein-L-isoaspartate(D-aspartate) O-methyltransferase